MTFSLEELRQIKAKQTSINTSFKLSDLRKINQPITSKIIRREPKLNLFDNIINKLNYLGNVSGSAVRYAQEAIDPRKLIGKGRDYYKEGEITAALKGKPTESFRESLKRTRDFNPASKLGKIETITNNIGGTVMDIASDPLMWVPGVNLISTAKKVNTISKNVKIIIKLSEAAKLSKDIPAAGKYIFQAEKLARDTKKISSLIGAPKKTEKIGDILKRGISAYDKVIAGAVISKGVSDAIRSDNPWDAAKGMGIALLGGVGLRSSIKASKVANKALETAKNSEQFAKNVGDYIEGISKPTNIVEKVVGKRAVNVYSTDFMKTSLSKKFLSKGLNTPEGNLALRTRIEEGPEALNKLVLNKTISQKTADAIDDDLISSIDEIKRFSKIQRERKGLSVYDDETYLQTILEKTDGTPINDLDKINISKFSSIKNVVKDLGIDSNKRRKYTTSTRDQVLAKYGLRTKAAPIESLFLQLDRATYLANKLDMEDEIIKNAKKGEGGMVVYNPNEVNKFKKDLFSKYKQEILKTKGLSKIQKISINEEYDSKLAEMIDEFDTEKVLDSGNVKKNEIEILQESFDKTMKNIERVDDTYLSRFLSQKNLRQKIKKIFNDQWSEYLSNIAKRKVEAEGKGFKLIANADPSLMFSLSGARGVALKKESLSSLKHILEKTDPNTLGSKIESVIKNIKLFKVIGDFFQPQQYIRRAISISNNPTELKKMFTFIKDQKQFIKESSEAIEYNLQLGRTADIETETFKKKLIIQDKNNINKIDELVATLSDKLEESNKISIAPLKAIIKIMKANEDFAFKVVGPQMKLTAWKITKDKLIKKGISSEEAKFQAADIVNNLFGGQSWDAIMARHPSFNKSLIQASRIAMFAPDYLVSNLKTAKGLLKNKALGNVYRREFATAIFYGLGITNALNYLTTGHSSFENSPGNEFSIELSAIKDEKGNPIAISLLGNWGESLKILTRPYRYLQTKLSPGATLANDFFNGNDISNDIQNFLPLPLSLTPIIEKGVSNLMESIGIRKKKKKQTGVSDTLYDAFFETLLGIGGLQTTYRSGKTPLTDYQLLQKKLSK